ncbi:GntR family transcriptional regulator [Longimycelium tulufanense]|uniref:GntR family transcriptional regulator n=1 Tax=Longimycelium tulufanense TaxID=907463 RepID=A0A8J3C9G8_9PSEU|nr:GntR family transcriptional regulator [Longimycelium tulufanense]
MLAKERLTELVEQHGPGEVLPPERVLAEQFGVSRPTLRTALAELARAGLVVRQRGRGTFTTARSTAPEFVPAVHDSILSPAAEGEWTSRVLRFESVPAGARLGQRLQVSPATEVLRVTRLQLVGTEPMALERLRLPLLLVPDLTARDLEVGSFYRLLRMRYGITVADAVQTIESTVVDPVEAESLTVPPYSPALLCERVTRDGEGRVVELARSVHRGDRYRITSRLTFGQQG